VCAEAHIAALGSSALAAAIVQSRVRSIRSRFVQLSAGPSFAARDRMQALNLSVQPPGWISRRSVAESARQLPPWLGTGAIFVNNQWVWDAGVAGKYGKAWRSTDAPCWSLTVCFGDEVCVLELAVGTWFSRAAAATPATQGLPLQLRDCP